MNAWVYSYDGGTAMMEAVKERGLQLLSLLILVLGWAAVSLVIGTNLVPPPNEVFPTAWERVISGEFRVPLFSSLQRLSIAFLLTMLAGTALGIATARLEKFGTMSEALFTIIMTTPSLVIIFAAMMILGQKDSTIILAATLIVAPFVAVPMRDAMKDIDQDILGMADSFKAGALRRVTDVYIPYLIPPLLATSRIGFSLTWKMVIISEIFGFTSGIGWRIAQDYFRYNMESLIAWVVIFVAVVLVAEQLLRTFERTVVKWQ
ncbi:MAG: ABC transporter permease [Dehalococcoidia bacterium]